jgi:hypothetical protein
VILLNDESQSKKDEEYFLKYANKISKMNGWMIEEELARKIIEFDELEEEDNELREKTMREIEILQQHKEASPPRN